MCFGPRSHPWAMPDDAPSSETDDKPRSDASQGKVARGDVPGQSFTGPGENIVKKSSNTDLAETTITQDRSAQQEKRPPLPPRPTNLSLLQHRKSPESPKQSKGSTSRPQLLSTATTAVSRTDINTHSYQDGTRETFAASAQATSPQKSSPAFGSIKKIKGFAGSEGADTASIKSYSPTLSRGGDNESLLGNLFGSSQDVPAWKLFSDQEQSETHLHADSELSADFYREFDSIEGVAADGENEGK